MLHPLSATFKQPHGLIAALALLLAGMQLNAPAFAQSEWPEGARLTDAASTYDASTLPFYLQRPDWPESGHASDSLQWGGQPLDPNTRILPVLRSGDGRIEALLFIGDNSNPLPLNPVERLLQPITLPTGSDNPRLGAGLRFRASDRLTLGANVDRTRSAGMALLCNEDIGLATTLSSLSEHCLLAELGGETDPLSPFAHRRTSEQQLGASLDLADRGLDLSFGLSWLQSDPLPGARLTTTTPGLPGSTGLINPALLDGGADAFSLRSGGIGVRGMLDLGSRRWLSLDGQVSRTRIEPSVIDSLIPNEWNSGRLGIGMGFGDFSGRISGHVVDIRGSDALWGGLDIGFSWRTPWRAALTIGARNVVSGGNKTWPQENVRALEEAQSRVPYVQYQQDL
ncbi:MAG: hypothetical protein KDI75_05490 [Xanthomonadales bacterium]|nr:hypothetical protein [Xanthomonadales bacterium]